MLDLGSTLDARFFGLGSMLDARFLMVLEMPAVTLDEDLGTPLQHGLPDLLSKSSLFTFRV